MNKVIAFLFFLTTALFFTQKGYAQQQYRDVIYLKNGGITKGVIIEQIPNESLKIETADGSVFVYQMDEVEKIAKEPILNKTLQKPSNINARRVDPALSFLFSFLVPGVGQIYNGQIGKGIGMLCGSSAAIIAGSVIISSATYTSYNPYYGTESRFDPAERMGAILILVGVGVGIWSWIDAPLTASKINNNNGFALGKGRYLNISPEVMNANNMVSLNPHKQHNTAYGMRLQLTF